MADARYAICTDVEILGRDTRALTFRCDDAVGFAGGQYLIVDTGEIAASGRAIKRAYSIVSRDREQHRFVLASRRIGDGAGSGYMHRLAPGDQLKWSGPWGKLPHQIEGVAQTLAASPTQTRALVLATDTGITAALGLVSGEGFLPLVAYTHFIWLRPAGDEFLPDEWVRARLPPGLALEIASLPPVGHPERVAHVSTWLTMRLGADHPRNLAGAFVTGDGAVNYAELDRLVAAGLPLTRDHVESFFNHPKKAAAA
ncbi:MAG TPA: FAD-dependent oxidoreductase [Polyangia bacterium]